MELLHSFILMTMILLTIVLNFLGTILITGVFIFCVMSLQLSQSIRMGSSNAGMKAINRTPLNIIRKEEYPR